MKRKKIHYEETRYLFPAYEMKNPKVRMIKAVWGMVVAAGAVLVSVPFIWMVITSLVDVKYIFEPVMVVAANVSLDFANYKHALQITPFARLLANSFIVASAAVAGQVLICAMAAYALSKLKPPMYGAILILFLSTIMIPFETIAIPLYIFIRDFSLPGVFEANLINTYWALILPGLASAFNIFIFKSFFDKMPDDFLEAARVDGYSEASIFFKIVLPISKPILLVVFILSFVNIWNSFFWPLIVINEPEMYTLMLGIYKLIEEGQAWNVIMAAVTISMLPTIALFALFQKQIMRGVLFTTLQE